MGTVVVAWEIQIFSIQITTLIFSKRWVTVKALQNKGKIVASYYNL